MYVCLHSLHVLVHLLHVDKQTQTPERFSHVRRSVQASTHMAIWDWTPLHLQRDHET